MKLGWVSVIGGSSFKDLILPALTLGVAPAATISKLTRSSMLETFGEDYVRTSRSKGISEIRVIIFHVLRNSLISVVTLVGLQFAGIWAVLYSLKMFLAGLGLVHLPSVPSAREIFHRSRELSVHSHHLCPG